MRISHIEICNFRKLVAVRIDLANDKTVFVGANNSGKTSAVTALRRFLVNPRGFTVSDFSLAHWQALDDRGASWVAAYAAGEELPAPAIERYLPQLDIWLEVGKGEMHYAHKLIPTLDWKSGPLGVRLRFEPIDAHYLPDGIPVTGAKAEDVLRAATAAAAHGDPIPKVELWPRSLVDFLDRRVKATLGSKLIFLIHRNWPTRKMGSPNPKRFPIPRELSKETRLMASFKSMR